MSTDMEVLIGYEYLKGRQKETVVKELSLVSADVTQVFHSESPTS